MEYEELKRRMSEYKAEMTATERIKAYNAGQEVDHIPYVLHSSEFAFANIFGYTTEEFNKDFEIKSEIFERMKDEIGVDTISIGLSLKSLGGALGSKLFNPTNGIDYVEDHILKSYDDFDKLEFTDPYNNPVLTPILETAKRVRERFPEMNITTRVAGPISTVVAIRPIEMILRDTRKNPEMLHKLLDFSVDCSLKWFEVFYKELGAVSTNFSDPVTCMDVISKKQFDEFSLPYIQKLINGTQHMMGTKPSAHICGKSNPIWRDLADAGLTSISIDNCESLHEAKLAIGDRVQIGGNVPPVDVMKNGTIDEVIAACKKCLLECGDNPSGFILGTGCQVPIGTPRENMAAFLYAARKYGRGAKKGIVPRGILEED